jgi:hypothetical protein
MRPTTGLHQLLLEAFGGVVVATSANRSGEPISTDHNQLQELADGVLRHGLEIINPIDDAVMRVCCGKPLVLRLGRGLAPVALTIPKTQAPGSGALALGAQQKGSLAISLNPQVDRQLVQLAWERSCTYLADEHRKLVVLDEVNVALKLGYLTVEQVLEGLALRPELTHVALTGRGAPPALLERADLVTEMKLVRHPFREQGVKAQRGIEF